MPLSGSPEPENFSSSMLRKHAFGLHFTGSQANRPAAEFHNARTACNRFRLRA